MNYIFDIQNIAYFVLRSFIIDAGVLAYRPSLLGIASVFLGFQLAFESLMRENPEFETRTVEGRILVA